MREAISKFRTRLHGLQGNNFVPNYTASQDSYTSVNKAAHIPIHQYGRRHNPEAQKNVISLKSLKRVKNKYEMKRAL
jgi:hypothetical protein